MQEFPSPNFKSFNKALNKKILFPLDRISVSTSRNEEFVKKTFPLMEKLFSQPGISDKWEKLLFTSLFFTKQFLLGAKKVFL